MKWKRTTGYPFWKDIGTYRHLSLGNWSMDDLQVLGWLLRSSEHDLLHGCWQFQRSSKLLSRSVKSSSRTSSCRPSPPNSREKSGLSSDSGTDFIRSGIFSEEVAMGAHPGRILPLLKACGDEEKN